jgi:hypothetical protein
MLLQSIQNIEITISDSSYSMDKKEDKDNAFELFFYRCHPKCFVRDWFGTCTLSRGGADGNVLESEKGKEQLLNCICHIWKIDHTKQPIPLVNHTIENDIISLNGLKFE